MVATVNEMAQDAQTAKMSVRLWHYKSLWVPNDVTLQDEEIEAYNDARLTLSKLCAGSRRIYGSG